VCRVSNLNATYVSLLRRLRLRRGGLFGAAAGPLTEASNGIHSWRLDWHEEKHRP